MSVENIYIELRGFLKSSEPEVLCICGPWGVGKTHAWLTCLEQAASEPNGVALDHHSYVSVFGQSALSDVRSSIFENAISTQPHDRESRIDFVKKSGRWLRSQTAKYREVIGKIAPGVAFAVGERLMFASLKNQIVCIDDLERTGNGLQVVDLLGLVVELAKQKNCKVVILLNSRELGEESETFHGMIEKVADTILQFEPTPQEAADIGVNRDDALACEIKSYCVKLGLTNIRTIKRIKKWSLRLSEILGSRDDRILSRAIYSSALFIASHYHPKSLPDFEFINSYYLSSAPEDGFTEEQIRWREALNEYEYSMSEELDQCLQDFVRAGYIVEDDLIPHADAFARQLELQDQDNSFGEVWERYHGSFADDQEAILDDMFAAFKACYPAITPLNVSGTAKFFKDLGRVDQSRELVEFYVQNREEPIEFWDLDSNSFGSDIQDSDVRELFDGQFEKLLDKPTDPIEILERIGKNKSWGPRDIRILQKLSKSDFVRMFKRARGSTLRRIVDASLGFKSHSDKSSGEYQVFLVANDALEKISRESDINSRRVTQHRSRTGTMAPAHYLES